MKIAYIQSMATSKTGSGGHVHVSQVAHKLLESGHQLYTNLLSEEDKRFIKLTSNKDFFVRGHEIDIFYTRIHGSSSNDELTLYRESNHHAPCVWELNAPLEELRVRGISEEKLKDHHQRRIDLAKLVDAAICVSKEMEIYAQQELGITKTIVIPNGSDPELFCPTKKQPGLYAPHKFIVLWSGSPQYAWQGLEIIKKTAETMANIDPDVKFVVTAEGKSTNNLQYLGRVPYDQMPAYMASANAGLCVYEDITFFHRFFFSPLKLFDYMSSGIPIIGTNVGQIKEVINETQCGLLTDNSAQDMIEKILSLKNDVTLAEKMGYQGRQAVKTKYNWGNVVKQSVVFFEEIIETFEKPERTKLKSSTLNKFKSKIEHALRYLLWPLLKKFTSR